MPIGTNASIRDLAFHRSKPGSEYDATIHKIQIDASVAETREVSVIAIDTYVKVDLPPKSIGGLVEGLKT